MKKPDDHNSEELAELRRIVSEAYPSMPKRMLEQIHFCRHGPGCWDWAGYLRDNGYGQKWKDGRLTGAHRAAYEYVVGEIPPGLDIDHLCRNHGCINPQHLEPVTRRENNIRGMLGELNAKRSANQGHCKHGHAFTVENTRVAYGKRHCRNCSRNKYHSRKLNMHS